jgi:dTDP-6-deoxy-L-talose 4-dehydrogenase (NAD+)
MKRILVTGATGFIGNYVIARLLSPGDENVQVIATSANRQKAAETSWYHQVTYIPLDLQALDPAVNFYDYFQRPDAMIHLAWEGLPHYKSAFHLEVNYPRHIAFLRNMVSHGLRDLTATGTCLEYGMQEGCLDESRETHPGNPYAIAKDKLRSDLQELQRHYPFILRWVRLFYMYGKGQNQNSLFSQLEHALNVHEPTFNMSGGEQVRDYLPVEKVADYIVQIALQQTVTGLINCCSNEPVTVRQMVEDFVRRSGREITLNTGFYPYPDYEPMRFWGDNKKLKEVLKDV